MQKKIPLYLDMDDTVLCSSDTVVDILNERFNINPPKTIADVQDWTFRSIYKQSTPELVKEIFESEEFFNRVKQKPEFETFYSAFSDRFDTHIVTKGSYENLSRKAEYINKYIPGVHLIGLPVISKIDGSTYDKSSVDMTGGIQIDDRFDCLATTNAACKILLTNGKQLPWNKQTESVDNLYICHNWEQIITILMFCMNNQEVFLQKGF